MIFTDCGSFQIVLVQLMESTAELIIHCSTHSGPSYYNYKNYFPSILQAVANENKKFITVEVGGREKQSDGRTFHYSVLNKLMKSRDFLPYSLSALRTDWR